METRDVGATPLFLNIDKLNGDKYHRNLRKMLQRTPSMLHKVNTL